MTIAAVVFFATQFGGVPITVVDLEVDGHPLRSLAFVGQREFEVGDRVDFFDFVQRKASIEGEVVDLLVIP